MSHLRTLQPDPSDPPEPPRAITDQQAERESAAFLTRLTNTLAEHGGGSVSADLAADLVLNQIVEQARLATTATAAAIALTRGDEMVCRATTGPNAPGLGVRLNTNAGISGACVSTREVQRCDDTETDPRVDAAACRELGIRSMLVVPVLDEGTLMGVFEILSPRPHAFGDRDVQTLEALSSRIVNTLHRASQAVPREERPGVVAIDGPAPDDNASPSFTSPQPVQPRDYWTTVLTAIVVALALLLGWMLGRASWQSAIRKRPSQAVQRPTESQSQVDALKAERDVTPATVAPNPADNAPKPKIAAAPPDDTLVVYQNGKVIFRASPSPKSATEATPSEAGDEAAPADPQMLSPQIASRYLIERVEPEYPEEARLQRVQGDVVMDAIVAAEGNVREVKLVSGDHQLASAAVEAVRQWRFKPYAPKGQPVEFQTRVVVKFALP